jgi:hypothetical protein
MPPTRVNRQSVAHKSTGGILPSIPEPVDPVGNALHNLTSITVARSLEQTGGANRWSFRSR